MSLDAVAATAGVSKGGLLYHFPSKHALLRALVEDHVGAFGEEMAHRAPGWSSASGAAAIEAARAYVAVVRDLLRHTEGAASGIFAALTEDPLFMAPLLDLRCEVRALFARCPPEAMLVFHACEGLIHDRLIDPDHWDAPRVEAQLDLMDRMLVAIERGTVRFAD
ncbi:TetR/AcrR family transcriptional regulator [Rhodobacter sp. CZR27]|uniref:TetR/AcrR family transcriptional regulator n=1 Tax=Rhodobacter sp. CZR27 TaxID=2033869 RepID=UPI0022B76427|nr:TetR/AcrR family transcriptional regulator [Rhodobacter sp. CZR27]